MNEIVIFDDGEMQLDVSIRTEYDTIWLTQKQMSILFEASTDNIGLHIKNIYKEKELDKQSTTEDFSVVQREGSRTVKRTLKHYNLDMILSVGYRVKSKRATMFRKWANTILKEYMIQGYAVNEKRMKVLQKTVQIQSKIIAGISGIETDAVLRVIDQYIAALELLDNYDHQLLQKPNGKKCLVKLTYQDCRDLIEQMEFDTAVFGVEKECCKVEGILAAVYQEVFG